MADTVRKLNIWINDKQVEASFKGITNAMRLARNQLALMEIGSKEYIAQTNKIRQLQGVMDEHRKAQGQIAQGWVKITGAIKQIAVGNIIAGVFEKLTSSVTGAFGKINTAISDFEGGMTNVFTQMDDASIEQFGEKMKEGAKQVSELGFAMNDVTKSMFDAVSAGIAAGDSVAFMNEAAVLAKGGVTSLSTAVDGLTTIINAYDLDASEATHISEAFFTTSKFGKTTVDELASSIGKAAPIAKSLGISYQELLSAGSALTLSGIQTKEAFNYLKAAFSNLLKPSAEAEVVLKKFGIPIGATAIKAAGFSETLAKLNEVIKSHPDEIAKAITSVEGLTAIQALSGKGLERYNDILKETMTDTGANSSLQKAYQKQMESYPNIMAAAKEKLNTFAVTLGEKLAPYIKEIVPMISGWTKKVIELINWVFKNIDAIKSLAEWIAKAAIAIGIYNAAQKIKLIWDQRDLLMTQALTKAKQVLNGVMKATPWAFAIAGVAALVAGVSKLISSYNQVSLAQQSINDANKKARELMLEDTRTLEKWKAKLMDANTTQDERKQIINDINTQYGYYLPNLLKENSSYNQISEALGDINRELTKKYELQALEEKAVELQKTKLDLETELSKTKPVTEKVWAQNLIDLGEKIRAYATGQELVGFMTGSDALRSRTVTDIKSDLEKVTVAYAAMQKRIEGINNSTRTFSHIPEGGNGTDDGIDTDIIPGGGGTGSGTEKKKIDALKEYKKAYEDLNKEIMAIRRKVNAETLTEEEKQIQEIYWRYNDQLAVVDGFIAELQKKQQTKKGLNAEELELLNTFLEQRKQIISLQEQEILNVVTKFEEKIRKQAEQTSSKFGETAGAMFKDLAKKEVPDELEKLAEKIKNVVKWGMIARDAIGAIFDMQSQKDQEALAQFEESTNRKKEMLDRQLSQGLISQDNYNGQVQALDKKLEKEKKKYAAEEAKRQKRIRLLEAVLNTASAIAEALPNIPLSIAVGALGALQIAAIARTPIPKFAKGGRVNSPTFAEIGEAGPEIVLSNRIVSSPTLGPIADDLARIQEGKQARFLGNPRVPNFGGMSSVIGGGINSSVVNNTVINQVDNRSIDTMNAQIMQMSKDIGKMTSSVEKLKYLQAVISTDQITEYEEDERIRKRYSGI